MSDTNKPGDPGNDPATPTPEEKGGGNSEPKKPEENKGPDVKGLTHEQLRDNPLYDGVLKDLQAERQKRQTFEKEKSDAEAKRLEDEGKFKELYEKSEAEKKAAEERLTEATLRNAFLVEAPKHNIVDADAAWKLMDRSGVTLGDDGSAQGIEAALKSLVEAKPFLVQSGPAGKKAGAPSNPSKEGGEGDGTKRTYKRSELKDSKFFEDNKADIMAAYGEGRIEDDIDGPKS